MPALTPRLIDAYNAAQLAELPGLIVEPDPSPLAWIDHEPEPEPSADQLVIPGLEEGCGSAKP